MKKVLILAYDFPPYVSVAGLRPYSWYIYFKEWGIHPIVVTRQWSNQYKSHLDYVAVSDTDDVVVEETAYGTLIKTPYRPNLSNRLLIKYGEHKYKIIRKIISAYYELLQFFFYIGPKKQLYFAAKEYLKVNKVDMIIATGDPFILFKYASDLGKRYHIPWIADYRDLWSQDIMMQRNKLLQKWATHFEKKVVKTSFLIVTVSNFLKRKILLLSNQYIAIIPNGYDGETITKINNDIKQNNKFTIAFAGTIYDWHPLESFFCVCSNFVERTPDVRLEINFYGINDRNRIMDEIKLNQVNLFPFVTIYDKLPNNELLRKLAKETIFLLFNDYSILGTKIYNYLALKHQIILCYEDDDKAKALKRKFFNIEEIASETQQMQADMLRKTKSGIVVKNELHLSQVLDDLYTEFQSNGFVACKSVGTEMFSRKIQVKKLAEVINKRIPKK